jgi:site-specific DNA recombinase
VSPELVRVVHERLTHNKEVMLRNNKHSEKYLLRGGFIKCGMCGRNMKAHKYVSGAPTYICMRGGKDTLIGKKCTGTFSVMADKVDAEVWESVMTILCNPEYIEQDILPLVGQDGGQEALEAVTQHIKELDCEEANLTRAIRTMGDKPGTERLIEALETAAKEKQKAERELDRMQRDAASQKASLEKLRDV